MTIYEIGSDYDVFKFFVFEQDGESSKRMLDFRGQSLKEDWKPLRLMLFREPPKRKDKGREDFDASCYFSGALFVNKRTEEILQAALSDSIECLPVIVDGKEDLFVFINILGEIKAVNNEGLSYEEDMELFREHKQKFYLDKVKDKLIFRDETSALYYCTESLIELIQQNDIKGLRFEPMGEAK